MSIRSRVEAGSFVNSEPILDGDRKMGYLIGFSGGIQREIMPGIALTVDYVGNRGRDQTLRIDINEPRLLPNGTIGRPGPVGVRSGRNADPAAGAQHELPRVLQYQTATGIQHRLRRGGDGRDAAVRQPVVRARRARHCRARATSTRRTIGGGNIVEGASMTTSTRGSTTGWRTPTTGTRSRAGGNWRRLARARDRRDVPVLFRQPGE